MNSCHKFDLCYSKSKLYVFEKNIFKISPKYIYFNININSSDHFDIIIETY